MMIATLHMHAFLADQFWAVVGVIFSFELKQTVTTFLQAIQLYSVQFNYYNNALFPFSINDLELIKRISGQKLKTSCRMPHSYENWEIWKLATR